MRLGWFKMGKRKRSGSFSKGDDGGMKRSDAEDSQEELESEAVAGGSAKGVSGGIRCSARVQEKQEKLRRESSPSKQLLLLELNSQPVPGNATVVSTSNGKGNVKFPSPNSDQATTSVDPGGVCPLPTVADKEKPKKRAWELWSMEDKQLFFEALNEHGKDFDAIQNYLSTKYKSTKKSGVCAQYAAKNKDQVRHFYYRTWNKISKYLRFPDSMKKANQELYGLVNYGELRKKQRILNSKTATKLCELVENGITSIKFRSKTCRIKTPVCRALKKLNGISDIDSATRVPQKLTLEFVPKDGKTWRAVQSVSQNPRVKVVVGLQRTLASIILHLEEKWKKHDDRLKEQFLSVFGKQKRRLRVVPFEPRHISVPLFRVTENANSATICLKAYRQNVLINDGFDPNALVDNKIKRKRKLSEAGGTSGGGGDQPYPTHQDKPSNIGDYPMDPETSDAESQSALPSNNSLHEDRLGFLADHSDENVSMKEEMFARHLESMKECEEDVEAWKSVLNDSRGLEEDINQIPTETDNDDLEPDLDEAEAIGGDTGHSENTLLSTENGNRLGYSWSEEQIRKGWTAEEAEVTTIGELYLTLGQMEKICFEYHWESGEMPGTEAPRTPTLMDRLFAVANLLRKKKASRSKTVTCVTNSLGQSGQPHPNCVKCKNDSEISPPQSSSSVAQNNSNLLTNNGKSAVSSVGVLGQHEYSRNSTSTPAPTVTIMGETDRASSSLLAQVETPVSAKPCSNNSNASPPPSTSVSTPIVLSSDFQTMDDLQLGSEQSSCINVLVNSAAEISSRSDNQLRFERAESITEDNNATANPGTEVLTDRTRLSSPLSINSTPTPVMGGQNGLIELCSLATNKDTNISANITATLLPASSCMVRNPSGTISVVSSPDATSHQITTDALTKDVVALNRPRPHLRMLEPMQSSSSATTDCPPPKPFLDLPKGNRRLGRRPTGKRVVIPRVLPLLPKSPVISILPVSTANDANSFHQRNTITIVPVSVSNLTLLPSTTTVEGRRLHVTTTTTTSSTSRAEESGQRDRNIVNDFPKQSQRVETTSYESFLNSGAGALSCNSTDFEDLLKLKRNDGTNVSSDVDGLSLSSFMEISLPESAKIAANECMNLEDLDSSNLGLSMLRGLDKDLPRGLVTPESSPLKKLQVQASLTDMLPDFDKAWSMDGGDLSLSNLFHFDSQRSSSEIIPESEVNFQTILEGGGLDFSSKLTELTTPVSDSNK